MRLIILTLILLTACEESISSFEEAKKTIESLKPKQKELQEQASEEIEKIYTYEYKVLELGLLDSSQVIEERLAELGKDRWDCFAVNTTEKSLRFFCKRKPKSYLNYVPRVL